MDLHSNAVGFRIAALSRRTNYSADFASALYGLGSQERSNRKRTRCESRRKFYCSRFCSRGCWKTGYHDYDTNLAQVVGPDTVRSTYGKGYLLVFEADKDTGRIDSVFFVPDLE